MKVSIIMATYRQAKYLPIAILGVMNQTHPDIEHIIVSREDDIETQNLLEKYGNNPPFKHIKTAQRGTIPSRNIGIREADGMYVLIADSDDFMFADAAKGLLYIARMEEVQIVYPMHIMLTDENIVPTGMNSFPAYDYDKLTKSCYITDSSLMLTDLFEKIGYFDEKHGNLAWWIWLLEAAKKGVKIAGYNEPCHAYRQHAEQQHLTDEDTDWRRTS